MFKRFFFSIQSGWRYRKAIRAARSSSLRVNTLPELSTRQLEQAGIKALVLDFDGVMAAHGASVPEQAVCDWLRACMAEYPRMKWFILSNNPWEQRRAWFKIHFPSLLFISGVPKKPYPGGLYEAVNQARLAPSEVAIVDDRLLTGVLAAILAGCQPIWVAQPYYNYRAHPLKESFFAMLRALERLLY